MNRIYNFVEINTRLLRIRAIHIDSTKFTRKPYLDPGVRRRVNIFNNDDSFKEEMQDEEDIDDMESDFSNVALSAKEHQRELRKKRENIDKMITIKKFFTGPTPPNMLTWAERVQIRNLHQQDPEEWSIDALAESFPATREIISKIINSDWKPESLDKLKKRDAVVHENWRRLAEGKLELEPKLLNHLKKFIPRREEFLKSIETEDFARLFEKPKPKENWNNGQMSNILQSYERALDRLESKQKVLTSRENESDLIDPKTDREIIEERIEFENFERKGKVDTIKIGGNSNNSPSRPITLSTLKNTLQEKAVKGQNLNPMEKIMVEKTDLQKSSPPRLPINNRLALLAGYSLPLEKSTTDVEKILNSDPKPTRPKEKMIKTEESVTSDEQHSFWPNEIEPTKVVENFKNAEQADKTIDFSTDLQERNDIALKSLNSFAENDVGSAMKSTNSSVENDVGSAMKSTYYSAENDVGSAIKSTNSSVENDVGPAMKSTNMSPESEVRFKPEPESYKFSTQEDEEKFKEEESSIEGTFFWEPANLVSSPPVVSETLENSDQKKVIQEKVDLSYPKRIKIPKDKQGQKLTFKVNDCFYDDDGEFLYRVPGLTKAPVEEETNQDAQQTTVNKQQ